MVCRIFGPLEEREDVTKTAELFMLTREPVVVQ